MSSTIILAAAGSGKTGELIRRALQDHEKRVLITTYTIRNTEQIASRIIQKAGLIPPKLSLQTWYAFLLRDGIKPYQAAVTQAFRTRSINFEADKPQYARRDNVDAYYFDGGSNVYRNVVSDLACTINQASQNSVVERLEALFDFILVDELQDLVGYDLDFLDLLLASNIEFVAVGDPRQFTYATNRSSRNKKYQGLGMFAWVQERRKAGLVTVEEMNWSYRCKQPLCDFSDAIFPRLPKTVTRNAAVTSHYGVFLVAEQDLPEYLSRYAPIPLRFSKSTKLPLCLAGQALNIGVVKGDTFDRVLIIPTEPMKSYLRTGDPGKAGSKEKLYVAVTRARHSAAFVVPSRRFRSPVAQLWLPDPSMPLAT